MARLIDADALMDATAKQKTSAVSAEYVKGITECVEKIINAPTVAIKALEGRPSRHWIRHPEQKNIYGGECIECSECGEKYVVQYIEDEKFCRNCGADMRGGSE